MNWYKENIEKNSNSSKCNQVKLLPEQIKQLKEFPEQGMGYQIVDIIMQDGLIFNKKMVLNSMYLQLEGEEINPDDIKTIKLHEQEDSCSHSLDIHCDGVDDGW